jgi:probable phosphoglycerate mutase
MPKSTKKTKEKPKAATVLLIRHGENEWTQSHKLAGRTPGVHLNKYGQKQAKALGKRLAKMKLAAIYASPLERTMETAQAIANHHKVAVKEVPRLLEVDYGEWTGQAIKELAKKKEWTVVQHYPTGAAFPGGESMQAMQARMVAQVNTLVAGHAGETIAVVGHADLIKAAVAHYLGVHFDMFQRIIIGTASVTAINFSPLGPRVLTVNDTSHNPPHPDKSKPKKRK